MTHHGESLQRLTGDHTLVAELQDDHRGAALCEADRAMLDYAVKLAETPSAVVEDDVEALRRVGFSDCAILDVAQITAYFAFVTRLAEGLGVPLEEHWGT